MSPWQKQTENVLNLNNSLFLALSPMFDAALDDDISNVKSFDNVKQMYDEVQMLFRGNQVAVVMKLKAKLHKLQLTGMSSTSTIFERSLMS